MERKRWTSSLDTFCLSLTRWVLSGRKSTEIFEDFWRRVYPTCECEFSELLLLTEINLVLSLNTACYERHFSCITTDWTALLAPGTVGLLIRMLLGKKSGEMLELDFL